MKTKQYQVSWNKSVSTDVVGYKIYYVPEADNLDYGSPSTLVGDVESVIIPADTPGFPLIDGVYKIGLSAVDDVGNESDLIVKTVPFDLVAPAAPSELVITPV